MVSCCDALTTALPAGSAKTYTLSQLLELHRTGTQVNLGTPPPQLGRQHMPPEVTKPGAPHNHAMCRMIHEDMCLAQPMAPRRMVASHVEGLIAV